GAARRVREGARGLVVDLRGDGGATEQIAVIIASALAPRVVVGGSRRVRLSARARAARPEWRDLAEDPARPGWSADLPLATTGGGVDPGPIAGLIDAGGPRPRARPARAPPPGGPPPVPGTPRG